MFEQAATSALEGIYPYSNLLDQMQEHLDGMQMACSLLL